MEQRKDTDQNCDLCEQDFRDEVNELVDNVENHSQQQYDQKKEEVEEAFGNKGDMC